MQMEKQESPVDIAVGGHKGGIVVDEESPNILIKKSIPNEV